MDDFAPSFTRSELTVPALHAMPTAHSRHHDILALIGIGQVFFGCLHRYRAASPALFFSHAYFFLN